MHIKVTLVDFLVYLFVNFFWKHYYYDYDQNTIYSATVFIITGEPTYTASKQWHHMPHSCCIYCLKRRHLVASPLYSSTNQQLLKQSKYPLWKLRTISITNGSHHVPTTKSTLSVESRDEWNTKEGTGKSMKNALHVQQYGIRYLYGWSDVKQWRNQVHSLNHCWVTRIWRHQAGN